MVQVSTFRDVNGTIKSIREWSMAVFAKDAIQRRAFESIITAFLTNIL